MLEKNEPTKVLINFCETEGIESMKLFKSNRGVDVYALTSILVAGIIYLILRMKTRSIFAILTSILIWGGNASRKSTSCIVAV
jgi:hypothetical protein